MGTDRDAANDRYRDAARRVREGYRDMAAAGEAVLAADLTDLLMGDDARTCGATGIAEIDIRIEWIDMESTEETITAVRNRHGADVAAGVLARRDGATVAEWLTDALFDLPGRGYLVDALREADELPTDITIAIPA